jgi:hypothetical protein
MKKIVVTFLFMIACPIGYGAQPNEDLVKSCVLARSFVPSVSIRSLDAHEVTKEADYAEGFDATYLFTYRGADIGYAERKADKALVYLNRLYRLSAAIPVGDNRGTNPGAFDPALAEWSIVKEGKQAFFCVSFNFDGLGQSGSFQQVRGAYLLDVTTRQTYFSMRDLR